MSSATRTNHRRLKKKIKIGDVVTWGRGILYHKVIEIRGNGILVDVSNDPKAKGYTTKHSDGKWYYFVPFSSRGESEIRFIK